MMVKEKMSKDELIGGIQVMVVILSFLIMATTWAVFKSEIKSNRGLIGRQTKQREEMIDNSTREMMWKSRWCWFGIYIPTVLSILILQGIKIIVCKETEMITSMQIMTWIVFLIAFVVLLSRWGWLLALPLLVAHIITQIILSTLRDSYKVHYSGGHSSSGYYSG